MLENVNLHNHFPLSEFLPLSVDHHRFQRFISRRATNRRESDRAEGIFARPAVTIP